MNLLPKLRNDIQIIPARIQGRQVLAVKDLAGLRRDVIGLAPEMAAFLPFFDGQHSPRDLQIALMRQSGGRLVMAEDIERMVEEFDKLFMLQTERYFEKINQLKQSFYALDYRPLANCSEYFGNEEALNGMVENMIAYGAEGLPVIPERIRALVAPHIDLQVGGATYGKAYAAIRHLKPTRLIILGTGHALEDGIFCLTTKDYQTPFGGLPTDKEAVQLLRRAGDGVVADDDFPHRTEHAIEFQTLFLRKIFPGPVMMVPILCGSMHRYFTESSRPSEIPEVGRFLACLAKLIDETTLVVAGVDMCHVGPKFGHPHPASYYEQEFNTHDHTLLDALCIGSVQAFWAEGKRVEDRYHVCGFSALACLLELLPGVTGQVLDYQIWHEAETHSAVSYAAAVLSS